MEEEFRKEILELPQFKIEDKYQLEKVIGEGSYGRVYLAHLKDQIKKKVTVKDFRILNESTEFSNFRQTGIMSENLIKYWKILRREYLALRKLKDECRPNILCYRELFWDLTSDKIYLIADYIRGLDLEKFIQMLPETIDKYFILYYIAVQLIRALAIIHEKSIIHGDIKPTNIIIRTKTYQPVIIDFGLVCFIEISKICPVSGTHVFMAPEVFNLQQIFQKSDLWSLGLSFYICLYGQPKGSLVYEQKKLKRANITLSFNTPLPKLNSLLNQLLIYDMNLRPSALELLNSL